MRHALFLDLQTALLALALLTPRIGVCLLILPGFAGATLSGMVRGAVAVAIALPAAPPVFVALDAASPPPLLLVLMLCKEAALGALLALLLAIPGWVVQSIGAVFDIQRSPIPSQGSNVSGEQDASIVGGLLQQAVVLVLIQAGLFTALLRILVESYGLWPAYALALPVGPGELDELLRHLAAFFWHVVVYGSPVVIALLMVDFGFAMIGVFSSGLQISAVSAPVKCLVGLLVLLLYWPTLSHYLAGDFGRLLDFSAGWLDLHGTVP